MMKRLRRRRVRDREIRKLCRKLPVLVPPTADIERLASLISIRSFIRRSQRLHNRYLTGKMSYAKWVKYERMLGERELVVQDSIGNSFRVDRRMASRKIDGLQAVAKVG